MSVKPPRSMVAAPEPVRVAVLARRSAAPRSKVPWETLKVVVATVPLSVKLPAPDLVIVPEPRRLPVVRLLAPVRLRVKLALSNEPLRTSAPPVAVIEELADWVRFKPMVWVTAELFRIPLVPKVKALPFRV